MNITSRFFGSLPDGKPVLCYTLENDHGLSAEILDYGATIRSLIVPDRAGNRADIVLGQDKLENYLGGKGYAGAVIGRCANRIAGARFELSAKTYELEKNLHDMNIHSGSGRYAFRLFSAETAASGTEASLLLRLADHGEGGFPGSVAVWVRYTLNDRDELSIAYRAVPTEATPISITNHCYFNLAGHASGPVDGHTVQVNADYYLPNLPTGLPDGQIRSVAGTPFDLRAPVRLGQCFETAHPHMRGGFDHNFCLVGRGMRLAAMAAHRESGRMMRVYTDLEGMQLFTANGAVPDLVSKEGAVYQRHAAYCFETQHFPNAINYSHFPSCIHSPENPFVSETVFAFSLAGDGEAL